ncbi:MAG: 4-hydroxy-tetrahydrodipicolinate synthase [Oscillospiraceae bacterium]
MREPIFIGACTALITPFDPSGAICYDALAALIEAQIAGGIDALCVCGTTGEASTLSHEEQLAVISFSVKQVNHRVPVIAGAGSNSTQTAAELSRRARDAGADGLLHVTPYYNKASQRGLLRHYETIAAATELPIILYNVPGRTGVSFTAETYAALSQIPTINGIKEASGNLSLMMHTRAQCGDDFTIWSGNDDQVVPLMSLGARGVISVLSNLAPQVMVKLTHLCLNGEFSDAAKLQLFYLSLTDALFVEVNPIPVKAAQSLLGLAGGGLRLPLCDISPQNQARLRHAMVQTGLLTA